MKRERRREIFCIYCGTQIPEDAAFCPACGKKTAMIKVQEKEVPAGKKMYAVACAACGNSNPKRIGKGEYLCEHCGTRFFTEEPDDYISFEEKEARLLTLFAEAEKYAEKGDYHAELRTLSKGLELLPGNSKLLLRLGRACANLSLLREAMEYYRKSEKANPDYPIIYLNQAILYLNQDMAKEAKPLLEKALALIEADLMSASAGDIAIVYSNYALCIGKLGDRAGAEKYLRIAKTKGCSRSWMDYICETLRMSV